MNALLELTTAPRPEPSSDGKVPSGEGGLVEVSGTFAKDVGALSGHEVAVLLAVVVLVAAVAFLLGTLAGRRARRRPVEDLPPVPVPPEAVPAPPAPTSGRPDDVDGAALALAVIGAHDLAATDADRLRLAKALRRGGVHELVVTAGDAFDTRLHNAVAIGDPRDAPVGTARADAPAAETIVGVVRPGWGVAGRVLRPADVTVTARPEPR